MRPGEPGLRLHVGVSGAGKTVGMKGAIFNAARVHPVVCLDRMEEWNRFPPDLAPHVCGASTIDDVAKAAKAGKRLIVVRNRAVSIEEACTWAIAHPGVAGIALPEAHNELPSSQRNLPEPVMDVVTAWRHKRVNVALFCDTQRFSMLNTNVRDCSRIMRIYALTGKADLATCDELGIGIRPLVQEAARRMASKEDGGDEQPGWYVPLGLNRVPPYKLVRDV